MSNNKINKIMKINIGPQHPSTHGVLRLVLDLDGEIIKNCEPKIGYLHRGMEKIFESNTFFQNLPIVDRIEYLSSFFCAETYCLTVEQALTIEIPEKASYIRVLLMELNRISSHLLWLGTFMLDLGASSPLFYCFEQREIILNILEKISGQRMMYNFHTFGGVKSDIEKNILIEILKFTENFPNYIKNYENIITNNPIFLTRVKDIGIITYKDAINYALSGANLRASGGRYDVRKNQPYEIYNKLDFEVITLSNCDSYARYKVRIAEMKESLKIVIQCCEFLLADCSKEVKNNDIKPHLIKPEKGIFISSVEAPRGLLSCYLYSDGTNKPDRLKWRTPSFYSVQILTKILKNHTYSDLMAILGSLDIVLPEVDR